MARGKYRNTFQDAKPEIIVQLLKNKLLKLGGIFEKICTIPPNFREKRVRHSRTIQLSVFDFQGRMIPLFGRSRRTLPGRASCIRAALAPIRMFDQMVSTRSRRSSAIGPRPSPAYPESEF